MIGLGLQLILLVFAAVGFAGAGAAISVSRSRNLLEGTHDLGMVGVAAMLGIFGALCTAVGVGLAGVPAFGGVVAWTAYMLMSQHLGMFALEVDRPLEEEETTREIWEA